MELPATPFTTQSQSGELLPVYRDAYLRGDLARLSAQAVENYLYRELASAPAAVASPAPRPTPEQPPRFRHRALSLGAVAMMLAGAAMATNRLPISSVLSAGLSIAPTLLAADKSSAAETVVLHGRILNEKGLPVAGATVLHKGTNSGTSTDSQGSYSLRVPAHSPATLQYSYGGHVFQVVEAARVVAATPVVVCQR